MAGHSFLASASLERRRLQACLAHAPEVVDAVIQGDKVRVITRADLPPELSTLIAEAPDLSLTPTPPRFEDSFVARLLEKFDEPAPGQRDVPLHPMSASDGPARTRVPTTPDEPVITVEHLTRRFGQFVAVNDVTFSVGHGEIFGLLGANGAGKSTTFRMLCGLLPPSEGSLRVAGFDLRKAAAPARGRIGYMAQKFSLYANLSVQQNLRFFSSAYKLVGARQKARISWAVEEFGLGPMLDATADHLPLGFKQRLALACALMHEPEILFLDEPTSGVDPLARREFWRRINALADVGVTVLVTTHFMEEAEYCDRLVIMAEGRVLTEGTPEAIKDTARRGDRPDATMEDAFISVVEAASAPAAA
jgi:ABC-2 type transport system ATP-binding protein